MKYCPFEDCDEQIQTWQNTCYQHKNIKGETQMNENNYGNPQPGMPQQPVQQPPQRPEPQTQPVQEPTVYNGRGEEIPQTVQKKKQPVPVIIGKIPENMQERDRLIVKQVAFKSAIDVYLQMNADAEVQEYDTLIAELQKLTVDFFKVIVAKNEKEEV